MEPVIGQARRKKIGRIAVVALVAILGTSANLAMVVPAAAQKSQMRDDIEQLAMDLHVGIARSTMTPQQKEQLRDDFKELVRAHKNHEMFAELRAARSIRVALNSGAFKPEDRQRIKHDMDAIKEAREDSPGGFHF